jgi:predicted nucleotidyltransferase
MPPLEEIERSLVAALRRYGPRSIAIFGSYARGEAGPDSDLDLLVDFKERKSLLTLVRIERELSETLGIKVDLLTEPAISPYMIDRIKSELRVVHQ